MPAYKISTEIIYYVDSEDEAWDAFAWIRPDEMPWSIEKIVTND
jgi:hypothetical protein